MATAQQFRSVTEQITSKNKGSLTGKDAWRKNLSLASLAAFKIGSCLGPRGAYKLVMYQRGPEMVMKVTKDALDMVDELGVQYPAIKTLAEAAEGGCRAWAAWRGILSRGAKGQSSTRVFKAGRCVSGRVRRQGLSAARTRRAGADQRAGAAGRDRL